MKKVINIVAALLTFAVVSFGAQNFVRDAGYVVYSNSGAAISAGDVVDVGDSYGVALVDIASNATGVVRIDGVWDLTLATNETITVGDKLYWDSSNEQVTETSTADTFIGTATEAVTTTSSTGILAVWLNAAVRDVIVGVDAQAYDADLTTLAGLNGGSLTNLNGAALQADTVDSPAYAAGSIDNEHLADDAVDSDEIADGAVDFVHVAANFGADGTFTNSVGGSITVSNGVITAIN